MTRPKAQTLRQGHGSTVPEFRQNPEPVVAPDPPKTLDAYGNRLWYELWQAGRNAYQPGTDFLVIERYCQLQSRRRQLLTIVEEEGWMAGGSTGQPTSHPAAKLIDSIESKLVPLEDRLGLNPQARYSLGISSVEHTSKLAAFLERQGGH